MNTRAILSVGLLSALQLIIATAGQADERKLINPIVLERSHVNPIVFQRSHLDPEPGAPVLAGKLWIMEADGSRLRQLTFGQTYDEHPSIFSDQRHVLYSQFPVNQLDPTEEAKLIKLDILSGEHEVFAQVPGFALHHATVSPIADKVAYHRDKADFRSQWVGWGPGSYEVNMVASNGVAVAGGIIFMHEKNLKQSPRKVSLVRLTGHGPGSRALFLTDDDHLHRRPAVSPDAQWIAWQTDLAGSDDEIYLAKIDGSEPRNLTRAAGNDGHPWFSRDGKWIVFESDRTGQWEIWRLHLDTLESRQLTFGAGQYASTRPRM